MSIHSRCDVIHHRPLEPPTFTCLSRLFTHVLRLYSGTSWAKIKMPGSSLWLIPPSPSSLETTVQTLITDTIPSLFPATNPPDFIPHITLTSHIPSDTTTSNSQQWLDSLDLPELDKVTIRQSRVGEIFFQKLTLACLKTPELTTLATECRKQAVGGKVVAYAHGYYPHMSLM